MRSLGRLVFTTLTCLLVCVEGSTHEGKPLSEGPEHQDTGDSVTALPGPLDVGHPGEEHDPRAATEIVGQTRSLNSGSYFLAPGETMEFESENYPADYPFAKKWTWEFDTLESAMLSLECDDFQLESSRRCKGDYLEVIDLAGSKKRFCARDAVSVSGTTQKLKVIFRSNKKRTEKGFRCSLRSVEGTTPPASGTLSCGMYTIPTGESRTFESTNYPSNYPGNTECTWNFNTEQGSSLHIACDDFALENSRNCARDSLSITDFNEVNEKYCGVQPPFSVSSSRQSVRVQFVSNKRRSAKGFSCQVTSASVPAEKDDCNCGRVNRAMRIVGGTETEVNEYPWMVGLLRNWYLICGGSIVSDRWILTAAHCAVLMDTEDKILIGDHDYSVSSETNAYVLDVSQIVVHSGYNSRTLDNDIALIKVSSAIEFRSDNTVSPVCLPPSGDLYSSVLATITGWGAQREGGGYLPELYEVTVPTMTNAQCSNYYSGITANMICAGLVQGGKDSCQGDSGGPMVYDDGGSFELIGVVSWGRGCARPENPGVYARVNRYLQWINGYIADSQTCPR